LESGGSSLDVRLQREEAADAEFLQFRDGALEQVPQDFDADFLGEVKGAKARERVGPLLVFEVERVDGRIVCEEPAVERGDLLLAPDLGALVDRGEEVEETLPCGVPRAAVGPNVTLGLGQRVFWQQPPILAEGDEDDAVQDLLRDPDGLVEVLALFQVQVLDEFQPSPLILLIEFIADLLLALLGLLEQGEGAGRLLERRRDQPAALEQGVELVEAVAIAQLLKRELLVVERALAAVVEPDSREVGDDAPRAIRQGVEVIPALLDGSAAVGTVSVEVGLRVFELDHDGGRLGVGEVAQRGVGGADIGNRELVFDVEVGRAPGLELVSETLAEELIEELRVDRCLFVLGEVAGGFKVGPLNGDGVRLVLRRAAELLVGGGFLDVLGNE